MELREHQSSAIEMVNDSISKGKKKVMLAAPCSFGKTMVAVHMLASVAKKGGYGMFICDRIKLVQQAVDEFDKYGVEVGVIQGWDHPRSNKVAQIQIASVQTLARRKIWPYSNLIIIDEAHVHYKTHTRLMEEYPEVPFIGLSATPFSKGLGNHYDNLIVPITAAELMGKGYLAPVKYYGGKRPDLKGVKTKRLQTGATDYEPNALAKRMEEDTELVGDIVKNWQKYAENSQTIAFSPSIIQSKALVNMFNKSGIPAEHIDGYMDDAERQILYREHDEGKFKILSCSRLLNTGYDAPSVRCLIDAFPTKSITQWVQRVGRVLRLHEEKEFAIVLDHAGNVDKLGFAEDVVPEVLDDGDKQYRERSQVKKDEKERDTMDCPMCYQVMKMPSCECGYELPIKMIVESDNQILRELTRHSPEAIAAYEEEQRQLALKYWRERMAAHQDVLRKQVGEFAFNRLNWLGQFQAYGQAKGYKPGWSAYKYKDKFGMWPTAEASRNAGFYAEVTQETKDYITHTIIKANYDKRNTRSAG
tara:strand:+ start:416 stop:2008 length:1593 start_codon:yes stop_codon:yes gene_type:complete